MLRWLIGLTCLVSAWSMAADSRTNLFELSIEELGMIRVAGTHIRGSEVAIPMAVVTRGELDKSGFITLQDLFDKLPQNFDEVTPDGRFANEGGSLLRGQNNARVSAIDLRGLGAQSTLTLVNGSRRAGSVEGRVVDVSAIPLSFIDRVEVATGGRSAIYGADAVAGVVNLVTRREFEGSESQISMGAATDRGGEQLQLSHILGRDTPRWGFVAAYDFMRIWPLDLAEAGLLSLQPNPEIGLTQLSLNARADSWRHSAYLSGRYALRDEVDLYGEALFTDKEFEDFELRRFAGASQNSFTDITNEARHLALTAGARAEIGNNWHFDLSADRSTADDARIGSLFIDLGFTDFMSEFQAATEATLSSVAAVADGPLPAIGGIRGRMAAGAEWRQEELDSAQNGIRQPIPRRTVRSAFGELSVPVIARQQGGGTTLDLSLAARYDDYSDFGGTFNPQLGLIWQPVEGFKLRAAWSTAFRAPALVELTSEAQSFIELAADPSRPGEVLPVLFVQGEDPDLGEEEAETWSVGFDLEPSFAQWAELSLDYFNIEYDGRIEQPSINADRDIVLLRADRFPGLITSNPTAEEAAAFIAVDDDGVIQNDTGTSFDPRTQNVLDVFPDLVLFDNRLSNIAIEKVSGFDLRVAGRFETEAGDFAVGLNLTHTFDHDRRVTAASPEFSLLNEIGKPVDTRIRASGGWSRGAWAGSLYYNYTDGYRNPFSTPASGIGSWSTVDISLRLDGSAWTQEGPFAGLSVTLAVQNLFDNDPPLFPNSLQGVLYDSINANPFGRFVSMSVMKRWLR